MAQNNYIYYIIELSAVQYSKDKGWSSWLDTLKTQIPEVSEEATQFFDKLNNGVDISHCQNYEKLFEQFDIGDKNLQEFIKTWDGIGDPMEAYKIHLQNTATATSKWSNITKKAATIAKSFGAALGSMAVNFAIGMAIDAVTKIATSYSDMVKHAQEATKIYQVINRKIRNFRPVIIISPCAAGGGIFSLEK